MNENILISTTPSKLNVRLINDFIATSYWGKGRTMEQTKKTIKNSLNFGVHKKGEQIGYARVVTDYAIFAYLADVFIIPAERGNGYSKELIEHIITHPKLKDIKNWKLATSDAHGLYQKYGFNVLENPQKIMERNLPDTE